MTDSELSFDDAVLLVIDELATPHPGDRVDHVLAKDAELEAFLRLPAALDALGEVIGECGTFDDAIESVRTWQEALAVAEALQSWLHE